MLNWMASLSRYVSEYHVQILVIVTRQTGATVHWGSVVVREL
jgi:hypothetical protein